MNSNLLFFFHFLLLLKTSNALVVDVPSGRVKCLTEDLRRSALSYARYRVVSSFSSTTNLTVSTRVSDPFGETIHHAEEVERGEFSFQAEETGKHTACFWSPRFEISGLVSVEVEWKTGIRARDWKAVVKKGDIDVMEMELKKLEDSVKLIHEDLIFLREREAEAQRLNEETISRMDSFGLLSLVICLGVAGLQLWHLKAFFEKEKIL
ncbi:transmembrane emp24 domain-containing protein p24delta9-like [Typha latifolia]|uniref:transmembrane emp24 domain-containing protein p24delta9-like n=1 Tax=Typha latifolia TaxID=4733 RepID=UPI003C301B52